MENVGQDDSKNDRQKIDPLVWHYERERRIKIRGSVQWSHVIKSTDEKQEFFIRSNFDLVSNGCYIDVLIPSNISPDSLVTVFDFVLKNGARYAVSGPIEMQFPLKEEGFLSFDSFPNQKMSTRDCKFTGRVFVYTSFALAEEYITSLCDLYRKHEMILVVRDGRWINEVQKYIDRPVVFIGHDSADKDILVRSLAHAIDSREVRVWYDEISLRPGDRLRKSLDSGLEEADYFIPIITENWMKNERYAGYEFDAIMQKFISEKSVTIIPVCVGLNPSRLKEKSRVLADILAIVHSPEDSVEILATKIVNAVDPRIPNVGEPLAMIESKQEPAFFNVSYTIGPM